MNGTGLDTDVEKNFLHRTTGEEEDQRTLEFWEIWID